MGALHVWLEDEAQKGLSVVLGGGGGGGLTKKGGGGGGGRKGVFLKILKSGLF